VQFIGGKQKVIASLMGFNGIYSNGGLMGFNGGLMGYDGI
jgi:hypothetical protein